MSLFRRARVIHEKPRPAGVTAAGAVALVLGLAILAPNLLLLLDLLPVILGIRSGWILHPSYPSLAAVALLLVAGAGLLRRWRRALYLALGLALAGAAGSGAALVLERPLPLLDGGSAWGWLLGLWYCLLVFFYLRQKRIVEIF